jgi:hypothetical protein
MCHHYVSSSAPNFLSLSLALVLSQRRADRWAANLPLRFGQFHQRALFTANKSCIHFISAFVVARKELRGFKSCAAADEDCFALNQFISNAVGFGEMLLSNNVRRRLLLTYFIAKVHPKHQFVSANWAKPTVYPTSTK